MAAVDDSRLYPIGDVARRTGLSVSAIRYYADAGVIEPTEHTEAGYRLYDIRAIAGLELVRTLRELGAGLADIRKLLAEETTLADLAAARLDLLDQQLRTLRSRRAVLRTIVKLNSTTEQVSLMHKLASMSDDDRHRLIDEFWTEVTDGLEAQPAMVERLRKQRPNLPEEPTAEQLEAWIELADLVADPDFRSAVSRFLHESFGPETVRRMSSPAKTEQLRRQQEILAEIQAAHKAGVPSDSAEARDMADRFMASLAAMANQPDTTMVRRQFIARDPTTEAAQQARRHVTRYSELLGRYTRLVTTINGKTHAEQAKEKADNIAAFHWLRAAASDQP